MKVTVKVIGLDRTINRINGIEDKSKGILRGVIAGLAVSLHSHIVREKLSGNPLKRVTGDLARSVNYKFEDDGMTAIVGANTPYAAYHEYGFSGVMAVREHVRRTKGQMAQAVRNKLGDETRPSKAKAAGTGATAVRAHSRSVNYPARSYMRTSLEEMRGTIIATISGALKGGVL